MTERINGAEKGIYNMTSTRRLGLAVLFFITIPITAISPHL
ncbi:hypothetical protein B4119_3475 [Parageobacillus caldoxylosilyticus]|uniref:Uncharacterized protein n=1 Tax=Saccharococcus caldoxylosilyticus TaxID=81408 RepID=A0A150L604_9BACL|nr:hypothetical protein B4119_3475 [Parageobacillus caldoxylosilyticus]